MLIPIIYMEVMVVLVVVRKKDPEEMEKMSSLPRWF
jgi:hypothetical protein